MGLFIFVGLLRDEGKHALITERKLLLGFWGIATCGRTRSGLPPHLTRGRGQTGGLDTGTNRGLFQCVMHNGLRDDRERSEYGGKKEKPDFLSGLGLELEVEEGTDTLGGLGGGEGQVEGVFAADAFGEGQGGGQGAGVAVGGAF